MDMEERDALYNQAKEWVLEAGEIIRHRMNDPLDINTKSNRNDLVTKMDKDIEKFFVEKINETYEGHRINGEEGYGDELTSMDGTIWVLDPIDGTMNFVHQKRNFAISLGIYHDGTGEIGLVYDVMEDILYHAKRGEGAFKNENRLKPLGEKTNLQEAIIGLNHFWLCENRLADERVMQEFVKEIRGTRIYGSAALEFMYTAEGILDGYLSMNLSPWDVAAGIVIVNEVGGVTTDLEGNELDMLNKGPVLTCNAHLQEGIFGYLNKARK